jgi:hypothetical protein
MPRKLVEFDGAFDVGNGCEGNEANHLSVHGLVR